MSRSTLDADDLNLIIRCLSDAMMSELSHVSWNQSDDQRDAERTEVRNRYNATTAKVCSLLVSDPPAVVA